MIAGILLVLGIREQIMIAQAYVAQGRYAQARPLLESARNQASLRNDPLYTVTLNELGEVYFELGLLRDALATDEEALRVLRASGQPETAAIGLALNNLGTVYLKMNLLKKAEDALAEAALIRGQSGDALARSQSLLNLASVYRAERAWPQAERLCREALAIRERILQPEDPQIAAAANNLGVVLLDLGEYAEAEPYALRALGIWRESIPPNHPLIASAMNNLGVLCMNLGRLHEAEQYLSGAIAIAREALPADHPHLTAYMDSYAALLQKMNRKKEATQLQYAALAARQRYDRANMLGLTVDVRSFR